MIVHRVKSETKPQMLVSGHLGDAGHATVHSLGGDWGIKEMELGESQMEQGGPTCPHSSCLFVASLGGRSGPAAT